MDSCHTPFNPLRATYTNCPDPRSITLLVRQGSMVVDMPKGAKLDPCLLPKPVIDIDSCNQTLTINGVTVSYSSIFKWVAGCKTIPTNLLDCSGAEIPPGTRVAKCSDIPPQVAMRNCAGQNLALNAQVFAIGDLTKCDGTPLLCSDRVVTCGDPFITIGGLGDDFGGATCTTMVLTVPEDPTRLAYFQSRDAIAGGVRVPMYDAETGVSRVVGYTVSAAAGVLSSNITNTHPWPVLLEADMIADAQQTGAGQNDLGFTFAISDVLEIPPPVFVGGGTAPRNKSVVFTQLASQVSTSINSPDNAFPINVYGQYNVVETSGTAKYRKVMLPGESVTLYGQFWVYCPQANPFPVEAAQVIAGIHGPMTLDYKLTRM